LFLPLIGGCLLLRRARDGPRLKKPAAVEGRVRLLETASLFFAFDFELQCIIHSFYKYITKRVHSNTPASVHYSTGLPVRNNPWVTKEVPKVVDDCGTICGEAAWPSKAQDDNATPTLSSCSRVDEMWRRIAIS
jgi:hypothetical protein